MTYIAPMLGVLAGLVGIADTIPYVRDTVRGLTRPHRGMAAQRVGVVAGEEQGGELVP